MGEQVNGKRRTSLKEAINMLSKVSVIIDNVCCDEQDAMENYPENLQSTDKYESMENAVDSLNDAAEKIEEAKEHISSAMK